MTKHVAVLMGGWNNERPVSLRTGAGCAAALREAGYRVTEVDVGRDIVQVLTALKPDVAFNALHGPFGEGGYIQGVLELLEIPYTHSGVLSSALAMNKHQAKILFKAAGIPVTDHVVVSRAEAARAHVMAPPYVIKPLADGSSFGVFIVKAETSHPPQELLREDWTSGEEMMVERFIPGRELTCAVMGDVALGVTEIITDRTFFNYEAKYSDGGAVHVLPAQLKPKIYDKVQEYSLAAHAALGCRGLTRCDFRYNDAAGEDGELVLLEINTQPGMTEVSLAPEQAAYAGHSYSELCAWLVEDASCNR
ncbi:D-alanine--D-alanine ligase [Devosia sp.]|jgi:D-alanine-D-alanine ligase|uniref:D-alanine--D-alanine ligase n=1 Tax=Devosia sp. TaxID=1871048 RepID=UPI001B1053EA|nr:D-alanine--D-alanine ligase [Devosia sp.]MBO9587520.1 D-alanine--D-alanine ligase [Devosia sp.]